MKLLNLKFLQNPCFDQSAFNREENYLTKRYLSIQIGYFLVNQLNRFKNFLGQQAAQIIKNLWVKTHFEQN